MLFDSSSALDPLTVDVGRLSVHCDLEPDDRQPERPVDDADRQRLRPVRPHPPSPEDAPADELNDTDGQRRVDTSSVRVQARPHKEKRK
jgi:hypothetical protein